MDAAAAALAAAEHVPAESALRGRRIVVVASGAQARAIAHAAVERAASVEVVLDSDADAQALRERYTSAVAARVLSKHDWTALAAPADVLVLGMSGCVNPTSVHAIKAGVVVGPESCLLDARREKAVLGLRGKQFITVNTF
jgi:shikimate 5-dehydrogenase